MTTPLQIPLPARGQGQPIFPKRCANCGRPPEAQSRLLLKRLVMRGQRQEQVTWQAEVPHCRQCARATKSVFLAGCIPFVLGFILVGVIAFGVVSYGASAYGLDELGDGESPNSLIVGAAAGLFVGLLGAFGFELGARLVLLPLLGPALLRAPLLAVQLINDTDYVAGVSARLSRDATGVRLTFANDSIASEFRALNPGAGAV
ncbi:MAG: hypothetical protein ABI847_08965 [Anaerolineales bacterium]